MKVHHRCSPDTVESAVGARVVQDVTRALCAVVTHDDRFVANDSAWFLKRGSGKITPCVMNAAKFLSEKFQNTLRDECGWEKEKEIAGQIIDAYCALTGAGRKFRIPADMRYLDFFRLHVDRTKPADLRKEFLACWRKFVQVGINDVSEVDDAYRAFFAETGEGSVTIRVGLEFETGNIASSFRALDKLETLFVTGLIEYGVFVTSIDKEHAAARIWPQSNRNGSFAELENRNYRNNRTVPLWEFGFEPDVFDRNAPYFNNSVLYEPVATGRTVTHQGVTYDVFMRGKEKLLRPVIPQQNLDSDAT
jgi:hypothetical protein